MPIDFLEFCGRHVGAILVAFVVMAFVAQVPNLDKAIRTFRRTYRARPSKL